MRWCSATSVPGGRVRQTVNKGLRTAGIVLHRFAPYLPGVVKFCRSIAGSSIHSTDEVSIALTGESHAEARWPDISRRLKTAAKVTSVGSAPVEDGRLLGKLGTKQ